MDSKTVVNNLSSAARLLFQPGCKVSFFRRFNMLKQCRKISHNVECAHTESEVLQFMHQMLRIGSQSTGDGVFVEAGCFKGGSTAKFSLAADALDRTLFVFDSFHGIPPNSEKHDETIFGTDVNYKGVFSAGDYAGTIAEVSSRVETWGSAASCKLVPGWFDDTLPGFQSPILAAYLDVDLASSTKTCLKYLYPLIVPGGILMSQDGHLPLVVAVFDDDEFWQSELGVPKPEIIGLGTSKLITVQKPL